jgi:Holliday junction resolvasome RuvABC ATP-dependent DNA helicase subunit
MGLYSVDLKEWTGPVPRLKDIVGQQKAVARLKAFAQLHESSGTAPGHVLLVATEGMGQLSVASAFAGELGASSMAMAKASEFEVYGDFTSVFTNLKERQFLLMKDVHGLRRPFWKGLREILHSNQLTITIGQGLRARDHVMEVRPFTMIATCSKLRDCPSELLDGFSLVLSLEPYSRTELSEIAVRIAQKIDASLEPGAGELLAGGGNGSPGHLELIMRRLSRTIGHNNITSEDVRTGFQALGIRIASLTAVLESTDLQELSGADFEKLVAGLLDRMGFQAETTKTSGDGGIDVIANLNQAIVGGRYLFQCKRYASNNLVGAPMLRDFYGAVTADRAVKGVFITTSDFTPQAREFGERVGLELIALAKLQELIRTYMPQSQAG